MIRLANFSIRRAKLALTFWVVVAGALVAIGLGVSDKLSPTMTLVPGSESSRAQDLAESEFGPSVLVPIMLEGPRVALDRQGPPLVRKLASRTDTRVLSAWDTGDTARSLRPDRTHATLVASVARDEEYMLEEGQEQIDKIVDDSISGPVTAHITGTPTLDRAIKDQALDDTRRAILIALPLMFIVLLLILRAPLAAAITTIFGGVTAFAGMGVMSLVAQAFDADAIAVALGSLMGMALGAGLALVILSRFHAEEAKVTGAPREAALAASAAVDTTGRAVLIGGTGLIIALLLASFVGPTENLNSIGVGAVICGLLAIGAAVVVLPALLALMGGHMFVASFGAPRFVTRPWSKLVGAGGSVVRWAAGAGLVATALMVALAIPVLGIETGPPDPRFLPEDNQARQDFEAVQETMGPGWPTPYNIVVASDKGAITAPATLRKLERFQVQLSDDERVESVTGPGVFRAQTAQLGTLEPQLKKSSKLIKGSKTSLATLQGGLGQAGEGASQLQGGLSEAAAGATQIAGGGSDAEKGAGRLRKGIADARAGSQKMSTGLDSALGGANSLKTGSAQALAGAEQLSKGLGSAAGPLKQNLPTAKAFAGELGDGAAAVRQAQGGVQAVQSGVQRAQAGAEKVAGAAGQSASLAKQAAGLAAQINDPKAPAVAQLAGGAAQYADGAEDGANEIATGLEPAIAGLGRIDSGLGEVAAGLTQGQTVATEFAGQLTKLSAGLDQLYAGSTELTTGITRLRDGNAELAAGIDKLAGGGKQLTSGLGVLQNGAGQLQSGLGLLTAGSDELATGLSGAVPKTGQLAGGIGLLEAGVAKFRGNLPDTKDLERLQAEAPGLFDSGYFVLAAIEGARPSDRNQATFAVNLGRGGNAGQIVVVPKQDASTQTTQELGADIQTMAADFGDENQLETAVGGPAGELADFESEIGADIWPVIAVVAGATALFLMFALRTVPLAFVAVASSLLVTAATFGVITLLATGDDPVLGGPGYFDSLQVIETFSAVFGITLIFEVLLLHRTRALFVRSGDPRASLITGLRDTAAAATGAAAVMVAAVVAFLGSGLFNLRLTVGLAVALVLEALIVRPVLLPAAIAVLGRRGWWPTKGPARPATVEGPPTAGPPEDGMPEEGVPATGEHRRFLRRGTTKTKV